MDLLTDLITSFDPKDPRFRPTELYNESWLVKLVLHQASKFEYDGHPLGFLPGSTWFSEAQLPTRFGVRWRGDPLAEARTHADGVIGHFRVGEQAQTDFRLLPGAKQFTLVEAKMGSPLSPGVRHAPYFDQAARSVACMAEALAAGDINPSTLERLEFVVLAPQDSIDCGTFSKELEPESIRSKVEKRVAAYGDELKSWHLGYFEPTIGRIRVLSLSWESAIEWISDKRTDLRDRFDAYYDRCLEFS